MLTITILSASHVMVTESKLTRNLILNINVRVVPHPLMRLLWANWYHILRVIQRIHRAEER